MSSTTRKRDAGKAQDRLLQAALEAERILTLRLKVVAFRCVDPRVIAPSLNGATASGYAEDASVLEELRRHWKTRERPSVLEAIPPPKSPNSGPNPGRP
jgi:hypothetical protein